MEGDGGTDCSTKEVYMYVFALNYISHELFIILLLIDSFFLGRGLRWHCCTYIESAPWNEYTHVAHAYTTHIHILRVFKKTETAKSNSEPALTELNQFENSVNQIKKLITYLI